MEVALILCPEWDSSHPIYSLALLTTQLKLRGHSTTIYDLNKAVSLIEDRLKTGFFYYPPQPLNPWVEEDFVRDHGWPAHQGYFESVVDSILSNGARIAAFSTYFSNVPTTLRLARFIKRRAPEVLTVLGGPDCMIYENALRYVREEGVDVVVYGEADISFPNLVDVFSRRGEVQAAPGILLHDEPATWRRGQVPPSNLDDLPFADYSGYRLSLYGAKVVHTCRGCVRQCAYCSDWRPMTFRYMSGKRVFREIAHQLEAHPDITRFHFGDSLLNPSVPDMRSLCDSLKEYGRPLNLYGYAIVRPDMTLDLLVRMREAGFRSFLYGVDSGSKRVLRDMRKNVPPETSAAVLRDTARAGIQSFVGWMVGFPTESDEEFRESLEFLRRNASGITRLYIVFTTTHVMQGPEASGEYNLEPCDSIWFWRRKDGSNDFPLRVVRARETVRVCSEYGIRFTLDGSGEDLTVQEADEYFERRLEDYRRWLSRRGGFCGALDGAVSRGGA